MKTFTTQINQNVVSTGKIFNWIAKNNLDRYSKILETKTIFTKINIGLNLRNQKQKYLIRSQILSWPGPRTGDDQLGDCWMNVNLEKHFKLIKKRLDNMTIERKQVISFCFVSQNYQNYLGPNDQRPDSDKRLGQFSSVHQLGVLKTILLSKK